MGVREEPAVLVGRGSRVIVMARGEGTGDPISLAAHNPEWRTAPTCGYTEIKDMTEAEHKRPCTAVEGKQHLGNSEVECLCGNDLP